MAGRSAAAGAAVTAGRTTVVIADDDPRILRDFSLILGLEDDLAVVAAVADGSAAVECCRRLQPDVVVLDVRMPVMDGIEATRHIRALPDDPCRVLSVTTFDLDDYVLGTIRAGASGFLLKDQAPHLLAPAVRTVARGDGIVSPRATARLIQELVQPSVDPLRPPNGLTTREEEVVRLLARGLTNEDIAERAFISKATVKSHVSHILTKLGLSTRLEVVVWAYERGLVRPSET